MRIALFGASGMVGSRVAAEAAGRGLEVTAITRTGTDVPGVAHNLTGDMADAALDAQVAADHDVIISATGPSRTGGDHGEWLQALQILAEASGDTPLYVVGGAGSLLVDGETMLKDTPGFPSVYKAEAETGTRALELLRAGDYSPWTMLSPAPEIAPGERTGYYAVGTDAPAGERISAEDFAVALIDDVEDPQHVDARFTVANSEVN
ncbi:MULTISPECIES: NAD(P)H-binding protein [unclassified Brevibacterium]|uniref:NAD(P)-dependent oxidoreductase n=1 Tax=unclassified Brevibacterium TaxID=2614124 RepID=UPI0010F88526|nr:MULTISPECIES: NAD(P)H-binding protein [unclassified Brevibacterium]MCM1013940.1 NAD(P)H-binding protein [Brevibacterium sp. XM4083]